MSHLTKYSKIYLLILVAVFAGFGLFVSLFPDAPVQALGEVVSPEVQADGTVTFRYYNPSAAVVQLYIEMGRNDLGAMCYAATGWPVLAMTNDGTGVWSVTIDTMEPNVYNYRFIVDGVSVLDPENPAWNPKAINNQLYVPGPGNEWQSIQDVPHGQLIEVEYYSDVTNATRYYTVYLPPNYNKDKRTLPSFYVSHGAGGNHVDWTTQGVANNILDNLIAEHKIRPMVVVMPNASGIRSDDYRVDLLTNIIPDVESKFRVNENPEQRAFAGLSMGGGLATNILLNNPEEFGFIGMWSGTGRLTVDNVLPQLDAIRAMRGIDISVGAMDFLYSRSVTSMATLDYYGIPYTGIVTPGDCHTWYFWRMALYEFLTGPLFKIN